MDFQIVDRQMIINQLEAIKILESTIRNEVIESQVWADVETWIQGPVLKQLVCWIHLSLKFFFITSKTEF